MDLRVERLVSGAKGLAHINGKSVFISNVLPDELVDVDIIEERKGFIEASVKRIIEPSKDRIEPICPYYGICGGCDFQIVDTETSARLKEEIVKDNLRRIGKLDTLPVFDPPAFSSFDGYRSRARVHVDLKSKRQGFLAKGSNKLINIDFCPSLDSKLNALLKNKGGELFKKARTLMFENRVNRNTGFVEIPLFSGDSAVSIYDNVVNVRVSDIDYKVSANVFFQSNLKVLPSLLSFVRDNTIGDVVMDLYSGVGTFSALFEGRGKTVYSVELQKECLALAKKNAPSAISYTSDVASWAKSVKTGVDTVIVDPPRVGLEPTVPEMISSWKPKRIIYVSCNSVTLSRDITLFKDYSIEKVKVFDFYPGSGCHVETVLVMSRI